MSGIKVRIFNPPSCLFRYAHFIYDCVMPEVLAKTYTHGTVYREKSFLQTIGTFSRLYEDIMQVKNVELLEDDFNKLYLPTVRLEALHYHILTREKIDIFRQYIFNRYSIDETKRDQKYPKILLIERGEHVTLIEDPEIEVTRPDLLKNGKEIREIKNFDTVESYLQEKYTVDFKKIILENMPFEEQVRHFVNASIVVGCHGAGLINVMFSKEDTIVCEYLNPTLRFKTLCREMKLKHITISNKDESVDALKEYI
jgi:capsular polysaccharide biosynthesis protein